MTSDYETIEIEIDRKLYDRVTERTDPLGLSVQDYVEQALVFAMQAEDLPDDQQVPPKPPEEEEPDEDVPAEEPPEEEEPPAAVAA